MATKKLGYKEGGTGSFGFKLDEDGDAKLGNSSNDLVEITGTLSVSGTLYAGTESPEQYHQFIGRVLIDAAGTNNSELIIDGPNPNHLFMYRNGTETGKLATDGFKFTTYGGASMVSQAYNDSGVGKIDFCNANTQVTTGTKHKVNITASADALRIDTNSGTNIFRVSGDTTYATEITASSNISGSGLYTDKLNIGGTDVTATATELNYVDGVSSNIQAQLNNNAAGIATNSSDISTVNSSKANLNSPAFTGTSTFASQPGFLARLSADQSNIAANNTNVTVEFDAEEYDIGSDFNTTTHQFTAPTTGRYFFSTFIYMKNIPEAAEYFYVQLKTTSANYRLAIIDPNELDTNMEYWGFQGSIVVQMTAGDTAEIEVVYEGTSSTADIDGGSINNTSWFNGYFMG